MIGYRFLPPAEEEMTDASLFYEAASSGLGLSFLNDLQSVINVLRENPGLGRPVARGLRQTVLRQFPFSLIYAEEPDAILIVAVAHQKQRPGYWRARMTGREGL
jgi:toxin ParE1/3/4